MYSRMCSSSSTTSTAGPACTRAPVATVPAGGVEGGNAPLVGPLADRALRDAEILRGLAEGQPVRFGRGGSTAGEIAISHSRNLPKVVARLNGLMGPYGFKVRITV